MYTLLQTARLNDVDPQAWLAHVINISTVLAGQRVGIKEVDDGIWLVSFSNYDLGYFDLEQKTLQPLDNPFGPRLSPMC
jgi:hypothetical protein